MRPARFRLTDSELLRKLMLWAPGGKPLTAQDLARRAGISRTKVYALLSGDRPTVERRTAQRIAEILGVHRKALFFEQPPSPMGEGDEMTEENTDEPGANRQ